MTVRSGKYNARRTTLDGIKFASAMESRRYAQLKLLEKAGTITDLSLQPSFDCVVNGKHVCKYKADFKYFEKNARVVEDVKGFKTKEYKIKKALVEAIFNVRIIEVTA